MTLNYRSVTDDREQRRAQRRIPSFGYALPALALSFIIPGLTLLYPMTRVYMPSHASMVQNGANSLAAALDRFRQDNGVYPASLSILPGKYIERMPTVASWTYLPSADRTDYRLTYTCGPDRVTTSRNRTTSTPIPSTKR